jgi:hypothetical protein
VFLVRNPEPAIMKRVLVLIRGCPVGWLGAYGNEWVATPALDRLAAEGVTFDRHISDCPEPSAARRAWRPQFSSETFTAIVRANREENDAPSEFYAGWGKVFDSRPNPGDLVIPLVADFPAILAELQTHRSWFLAVEMDTLLPPWTVPPGVFEVYLEDLVEAAGEADEAILPWSDPQTGWFDRDDLDAWELLHRSFAAVMTGLDADLGKLFDELRPLDADIIVTSDFGLPLGEHGILGLHRPWLYEELVHLPLIVRLADGRDAGQRVWNFTQPPDVPAFLRGEEIPPRSFAVTQLSLDRASEWAIRTDDWACLIPTQQHAEDADEPREPQLFGKPDDRREVNTLAAREPEVVEEFQNQLAASLAASGKSA